MPFKNWLIFLLLTLSSSSDINDTIKCVKAYIN